MTHYAVKIAYIGWMFSGSQRQPDVRTVEGDMLFALKKIGAAESSDQCDLRSAGRTDKGVSALGNVISFHSDMHPDRLFPALVANTDSIYLKGYFDAGEDFNPRKAKQRWYRYYFSPGKYDVNAMKRAGDLFVGYKDFSRFSRKDGDRNTIRRVNRVEICDEGRFMDVRGESFLWNMVRRMASAVSMVGKGEGDFKDIKDALAGSDSMEFPPLPPEGLLLMDVDYGREFIQIDYGKTRMSLENMLNTMNQRMGVLQELMKSF